MKKEAEPIIRPTLEELEKELHIVRQMREIRKVVLSAFCTLLVFAAAAVLISALFFPVLQVHKGSMAPTLQDGDIVFFVAGGNVNKSDVIAFYYDNNVLIKRVIATSGDTVDITDDGAVILNGALKGESYVPDPSRGECTIGLPVSVPADRIFVMGDNRATSIDSRIAEVGLISEEKIVGKALFRIWPLNRLGPVR